MTLEKKRAFTRRIAQANKTQIITILYEMAMEYLDAACDAFETDNMADFDIEVNRAQEVINELIRSLHLEYDLAQQFLQLYLFAKRELIMAITRHSVVPVEYVSHMMRRLHEAYLELEQKDHTPAQMRDTEMVFAGLTYGRDSLNESVALSGASRGFTA
ncbi:MAG: flagellar protein FliS [Lachnospiraceae bacterium]|nr:flagellar protein FliS [Lachnospiraceae bacterium]